MATLDLDEKQLGLLQDILDMWLDQEADTHQAIAADPTIPNFETLLDLTGSVTSTNDIARSIREKVGEAREHASTGAGS